MSQAPLSFARIFFLFMLHSSSCSLLIYIFKLTYVPSLARLTQYNRLKFIRWLLKLQKLKTSIATAIFQPKYSSSSVVCSDVLVVAIRIKHLLSKKKNTPLDESVRHFPSSLGLIPYFAYRQINFNVSSL